jgi:dihydroorotate dehydrogenase (fumarate)
MNPLSITYMGLELANPIVPSASPMTSTIGGLKRLAEAGAGAVIMPSLFEEQVHLEQDLLDHYGSYGSESHGEALNYLPSLPGFRSTSERYLDLLSQACEELAIPVIASLNGSTSSGWTEYAALMQKAGAAAIELNTYFVPTNPEQSGAAVEQQYLDVVKMVKAAVTIPVAVKISPFFSSPAHMARRLVEEGGADALVMFNRFYQPDLDLERLEVVPQLALSRSEDMRLPMTWTAILYGQVAADLAITGGVHTHLDVLKGMMAGATVTQMASVLLQEGVPKIVEILNNLRVWLEEHEYTSLKQLQGSMCRSHVGDPNAFERIKYMKTLHSWRPDPTGVGTSASL